MPRIIVHPDYLQDSSSLWQRCAEELRSIVNQLTAAMGSLDWQVRQSAGIEDGWNRARSSAYNLATQADSLARYLSAKAQSFGQADNESAANLSQVLGALTSQQQSTGFWDRFQSIQWLQLQPLKALMEMGLPSAGIGAIIVMPLAGLTGILGELFIGTRLLREIPSSWQSKLDQAVPSTLLGNAQHTQDIAPQKIAAPAILDQSFALRDGRTVPSRSLDGLTPVVGMDSMYGKPGQLPLDAPITSGANQRDPVLTRAVINQFGVGSNPRYSPDGSYTYCNTFAGDYARAMGVPLPTKAEMGVNGDRATIGAEPLYHWLVEHGRERGWREVDPATPVGLQALIAHVDAGRPALVSDPGHVAVIRPEQTDVQVAADLTIAQAGLNSLNQGRLGDAGLGSRFNPRYFIHD